VDFKLDEGKCPRIRINLIVLKYVKPEVLNLLRPAATLNLSYRIAGFKVT
jgi:hypothetical protein